MEGGRQWRQFDDSALNIMRDTHRYVIRIVISLSSAVSLSALSFSYIAPAWTDLVTSEGTVGIALDNGRTRLWCVAASVQFGMTDPRRDRFYCGLGRRPQPHDDRNIVANEFDPQWSAMGFRWATGATRLEMITPSARGGPNNCWAIIVPSWAGFAYSFALAVVTLTCRPRRVLSDDERHCRRCGYDMRSSPARCPECGTDRPKNASRADEENGDVNKWIKTENRDVSDFSC
jgi:hypothetical protein